MGLEQRYCSVALFDQSLVWFACGPWGGWRRMALPTPLEVRARLARACGIAFVGIQRVRVWRAEAGPCCLVSPPCSAGCQRLRRWYGVYVQPLLPACRVAWNQSAMVLPVVGDRCVPDKQVQAASVRVLFVGTSRLRGHPRRGWRLGLCVWRLSGRHGVPADWETPGLATSPSFPVGACVLSWHARGVPGHVRACAPPTPHTQTKHCACARHLAGVRACCAGHQPSTTQCRTTHP